MRYKTWLVLLTLALLSFSCRPRVFRGRGASPQPTATTPTVRRTLPLPTATSIPPSPPPGEGIPGILPTLPPYSFTTDGIMLEKTVRTNGYTLEYYRNKAYTCARKGYYTFLIVYPSNVSPQTPQALWIELHGGGLGVYGPDGTYLPTTYCAGLGTPCYLDEETMESFVQRFLQKGLMRKVREQGGFRFLVHSMCDHDLYMGMGDVEEPYNPNIDANGKRPRADGFLALRSALEFTRKKYPTTHIFVYGTSAGSVGALNLASILALEGQNISGVIADSGAVSDLSDLLAEAGCATKYDPQMLEYFGGKMGIVTTLRLSPDRVINAGRMKTPIYAFFNTHDQVYDCPPDDEVTIIDAQGRTYTGSGAQLAYRRLIDAINAAPPAYQAVSRVHEVCVGKSKESNLPCSTHIPTFFDAADLGGDQYRNGEDYNEVIMNWVRKRLKDPLPTLSSARSLPATSETGSISGALSYPSEYIPPQHVVAFRVDGQEYRYVYTDPNQNTYQITGLSPGLYHVVAYTLEGLAGGYTRAVLCGLGAHCTDHTLIDVEVKAGQDTPNIHPADWYAPAGSFPPPPPMPIDPPLVPTPVSPQGPSLTADRFAIHPFIHVNHPKEAKVYLFDAAQCTGKKLMRQDFALSNIEPEEGHFEWAKQDENVRMAAERGLELLGTLGYSAPWIAVPGSSQPYHAPIDPNKLDAFAEYVRQTVSRYPQVRYWEIWNEPNQERYYRNIPQEYAKLLKIAYQAVKEANPNALVLFGGAYGLEVGGPDWVRQVLTDPENPGRDHYDIANFHLRGSLQKVRAELNAVLAVYRTYGKPGAPLWITEFGYPASPRYQQDPRYRGTDPESGERAQAEYYKVALPMLLENGVEKVFVTLRDYEADGQNECRRGDVSPSCSEGLVTFSLQNASGRDRPAMAVYQSFGQ